jgi:hypothetical protein
MLISSASAHGYRKKRYNDDKMDVTLQYLKRIASYTVVLKILIFSPTNSFKSSVKAFRNYFWN